VGRVAVHQSDDKGKLGPLSNEGKRERTEARGNERVVEYRSPVFSVQETKVQRAARGEKKNPKGRTDIKSADLSKGVSAYKRMERDGVNEGEKRTHAETESEGPRVNLGYTPGTHRIPLAAW